MDKAFKYKGLLTKLAISALIIALLLLGMDFSKFTASVGKIHWGAWVIAAVFLYFQIFALSYRWFKVVNLQSRKISFAYALKTNLASVLAGYFLITSVGGILVRVAMTVSAGISFMRAIAATALDRIFTVLALILLSILMMPIWRNIIAEMPNLQLLFMLIVIGVVGLLLFFIFEKPRKKIIFFHRKIAMCFQYLRNVLTSKTVLIKVITASVFGQIAYFCAAFLIINSFGVEFSWLHFMAIIPFITFIASIPIGYGGWGIREGAFLYGLGLINIPPETAFAASVQIGIISMLSALIAGLPVVLQSDFRKTLFGKRGFKQRPPQSKI